MKGLLMAGLLLMVGNIWAYEPDLNSYFKNRQKIIDEYKNKDKQTDVLKYNYFDKKWSYEDTKSRMRYNYMENKWEWSK